MSNIPIRRNDQESLVKRIDFLERAIVRWAKEGGGSGGVVSRGNVQLQRIAAGVRRDTEALKRFSKARRSATN